MANFSNIGKKNRLGVPPQESEIKHNLQSPESYDVAPTPIEKSTLRGTGRTHQIATRVHYDFYRKVKQMALEEDITIAELIEKAISHYDNIRKLATN